MTDHTCDSRLVVTPSIVPGDTGTFSLALLVDAEALMVTPSQARFWLLDHEADGTWSHGQSGTSGPLAEMLGAITDVYRARTEQVSS